MPEKPKEKPVSENDEAADEQASWSEDQKKHEYYYDDAHGYEIYEPECDEDDKV